jgi:hypothetical protein
MSYVPTEEEDGFVWMSNDGRTYRMVDIQDGHLLNIIRFLKRRMHEQLGSGRLAAVCMQGELSSSFIEETLDETEVHYRLQINNFTAEANRRGLIIPKG